jgi:hypothetical protein
MSASQMSGSENAGGTAQSRARSARAEARTLDGASSAVGDNRGHIDFAHLKQSVSLAMVLSRYGVLAQLKRVGSQLAGTCPIHDGSDPRQFVVHLETSRWFCFGDCNRGGSILEFVALNERVPIKRAAELIAEWFAIGPPRHLPPRPRLQRSKTMTPSKPSHYLWIVEQRTGADAPADAKPTWHRIAAAWPQRDGKGLTIQLPPGVSVSGQLILREYDEPKTKQAQ